MEEWRLDPWMLREDDRAEGRAWSWIDLDYWPADVAIDRPVPIIAVGNVDRPAAAVADLIVPTLAQLAPLTRAIASNPRAAAVIVQLLRATASLPPADALTLESLAFAALQAGADHRHWLAEPRAEAKPPGRLALCRDGDVLTLRIDRPGARNAIDRSMRDALFDAFTLAALDDEIASVRLGAAGRCFGIGADLAEFGTASDSVEAHAIRSRTLPAWPLLRRKGRFEVMVQGACIGASLELAAFADRLVATRDAWFQLPELAMGIAPGFGGTVSLPRRIGRHRAAWLMLSGRRIDARTALGWGLVDAIMDDPAGDDRRADEHGA